MKLYEKKMRSVEDLKRERDRLLKESRRLDSQGLFVTGSKEKGEDGDNDKFDILLEAATAGIQLFSGPAGGNILQALLAGITGKQGRKVAQDVLGALVRKTGRIVRSGSLEVLKGYAKWKAIELSLKGVGVLLDRRKQKKKSRKESD